MHQKMAKWALSFRSSVLKGPNIKGEQLLKDQFVYIIMQLVDLTFKSKL